MVEVFLGVSQVSFVIIIQRIFYTKYSLIHDTAKPFSLSNRVCRWIKHFCLVLSQFPCLAVLLMLRRAQQNTVKNMTYPFRCRRFLQHDYRNKCLKLELKERTQIDGDKDKLNKIPYHPSSRVFRWLLMAQINNCIPPRIATSEIRCWQVITSHLDSSDKSTINKSIYHVLLLS
jgi:hypothetical protein